MPPHPPEAPAAPGQPRPAVQTAPGRQQPAAHPVRRPSTPYGIQPAPASLVRAPGAPLETAPAPAFAAAPASAPASSPAPAETAQAATPQSPGPPLPAQPGPKKPLRRRHERFCIAYVLGGNASRAAWDAGYAAGSGANQGYRLLRRPDIQARIADIQRGLGQGSAGDAVALIGKLEAAYRQSVEGGYFNAAARIVEVQARIAGHLGRRVEPPPAGGIAGGIAGGNDEK